MLNGWLDAVPELLRLTAVLWVAGLAMAVIRGVDFHHPAVVARNWALAGIFCFVLAAAIGVVVQLLIRGIALLRR